MTKRPSFLEPTNDYYLVEVYDPQSASSCIIRPDGYDAGLQEGIIRAKGPGIEAVLEDGSIARAPLPLDLGSHVKWLPHAAVGVERGRIGAPAATYKLVRHQDVVGVFRDARDMFSERVIAESVGENTHMAHVDGFPDLTVTVHGLDNAQEEALSLLLDTFTVGEGADEPESFDFGLEEED